MRFLFLLVLMNMVLSSNAQYQYPVTKKTDQVDVYHGTTVKDPYRWLEDDHADDTKAWVVEQNKVTQSYFDKIPFRKAINERLSALYNYPKYSAPSRKGEYYYYYHNSGLQNQSLLYRQKGLEGGPELVIDPNLLSEEGTTKLAAFSLSQEGDYAALFISQGGSDWNECRIMRMSDKSYLDDKLEWVKVSGIAWQGDGFYYSRYPQPEGSALAAKNENHKVYYHQLGTPQSADKLIYEDNENVQRFHMVTTSEDQNFAILSLSDRGKGLKGNALMYLPKGERFFQPIVPEIGDSQYWFIDNKGPIFIIGTNKDAPNEKVMAFDTRFNKWTTLIEEKPEPIQSISTGGGRMFVTYLKDVAAHTFMFDLDGKLISEIELPGLGNVGGFGGNHDDKFLFYSYTSFTHPSTIYKLDLASGKSSVFRSPEVDFKAEEFVTKQVFYTSKDGTKVPMFIVHKKGLKMSGDNPTLLYGYGGFNISLNPGFNPMLIAWLEQGGVYAQANLRGGGEYGEAWHEQGMKLKKQNVFDDFIAAGEYLINQKYCDSKRLALRGGSNGGLLVGTVINQRPDLAGVAIPQVGVMDMLRFQKFTIGWNWITDYGSSDNEEEFKVLYGYSPMHNIRTGVNYPATLITTADHDDRVVPAHSFKYAATLQATASPSTSNPLLISIEVNSGHGASNTKKVIENMTDIYAFIWKNMGFTPKY